jgi:hypothetical protein
MYWLETVSGINRGDVTVNVDNGGGQARYWDFGRSGRQWPCFPSELAMAAKAATFSLPPRNAHIHQFPLSPEEYCGR